MSDYTDIGIDIVRIDRMLLLLSNHYQRLMSVVFNPDDLIGLPEYKRICEGNNKKAARAQARFLAMKFAAKEAVIKTLGPPIDTRYELSDITVNGSDDLTVELRGPLAIYAQNRGINRLVGCGKSTEQLTLAIVIGEIDERNAER